MRKATSDMDWVFDDEKLVGVCLGYDYCAEHEWGTKGINSALGIWSGDEKTEKRVMGYDRKRVTDPSKVIYFEHEFKFVKPGNKTATKGVVYAVALGTSWVFRDNPEDGLKHLKKTIEEKTWGFDRFPLLAAWDEKEFMFWSVDEEKVKAMYEAFQAKNILKGVKPSGPFGGNGLLFMMADACSKEDEEQLIFDQKAYRIMWEDVTKNGILDRLRKADCKYFACSPRQNEIREGKKPWKELKHIKFWLNPQEQRKNESGWYTVQELDQWTKGEGPIPAKNTN